MTTHIRTVVSRLVELAKTSTMSSRHAAAVLDGKRVYSVSVNYAMPAGDLVDFANKTSVSLTDGTYDKTSVKWKQRCRQKGDEAEGEYQAKRSCPCSAR